MSSSFEEAAKALRTKSQELDTHLTKLKSLNDTLLDCSGKLIESLCELVGSAGGAKTTCNLCFSRPREYILVPCGHGLFCRNCADRCKTRNRCPVCRGRIDELMRVFQ